MTGALAIGWSLFAAAAWLLIRYRQRGVVTLEPASDAAATTVSVIIPARDEERSIGRCVSSLLGQDHAPLEVIVVDDGSTDRTAAIAGEAGATVVTAPPLPDGWTGKPHACAIGADAASGDWLLFVDADTVAEPGLISASVWINIGNTRAVVSGTTS